MPRFSLPRLVVLFLVLSGPASAEQWDTQFGSASPFPMNGGFNGLVRDVLVDGNDVYVCGDFTAMGSTPVSRIAHWNGSAWSDIGPTITFTYNRQPAIMCLAKYQDHIVAAGAFVTVNGQPGNLALWDGSNWSAATGPDLNITNLFISSLMSDGPYLYIGSSSDGGIWKWDGSATVPLMALSQKFIYALLAWNGELYAGGSFQYFEGTYMYNVARWDGSWHTMAGGIPSTIVNSLLIHDNTLYAVGMGYAWSWNGSSWIQALPTLNRCEFTSGGEGLFVQDRLYMSGPIGAYNGLAVSNGSVWETMGGGLSPMVCFPQLAEYQGKVLVAGQFNTAGGLPAPGVALWNHTSWYTRGADKSVNAMTTTGSDVFAFGLFERVLETPFHRAARWDGSEWHALGSGIDGTVNAAVAIGSDVYVGGSFTDAGGSGAVNLAKWNGSSWAPVGLPLNGPVFALATDGTSLYVGGAFEMFQNEYLARIARWDGSAFHALGQGVRNNSVRAILVDGIRVYAAGDFSLAGNNYPTGNAAYFDGDWHTLGNGFYDGRVRDLELHDGVVFAAGDFTVGHSLNHIAAWDGSVWVGLPSTGSSALNGDAYAMLSSGDALYVTGDFTTAGGAPANHIARWQNLNWHSLGSGLDARANALASVPGAVYAGGEFRTAGGSGSYHFARWMEVASAVDPSPAMRTSLEAVFPNPFNPSTSIRYRVATRDRVTLAIYDVTGRLVRQLFDREVSGSNEEHVVTWDGHDDRGSRVASGVYFVRMATPSYAETRKMVLLK